LSPSSNHREDAYGGTPENRYGLVEEILNAVAEEIEADRVALRLSPQHNILGIEETDAADARATYGGLLRVVADLGFAYFTFLHAEPTGELITEFSAEARPIGPT